MAIYHLTAKTVSRGESASAAIRNDYIDRMGRYSGDQDEVLHKDHGNMPAWAQDNPREYWEAADTHERANGRLFKQLEFALPKELSPEQQTALAASFCRDMALTKDGPLPYSFAIHKGHDKENPHCHLMISERVNDGHKRSPASWFKRAAKDPNLGGARKTNELRPREWLLQCRQIWAERANMALTIAGHESRIDHRTLKAQGIDREPAKHLGPAIAALERQGVLTARGDQNRQREERARAHPLPVMQEKSVALEKSDSAPVPKPAPTMGECQAALLAIAKQEPHKMEYYYQEQIKPYLEYIAATDDTADAFAFCQERMQEDVSTAAGRLKEMGREISEKLRRIGGTGSQQIALKQEAMDHIRLAPDREMAFAEVTQGIDLALTRSRGLGR